jgi:hypothetical protein
VVATDINPRFLTTLPAPNVEVRQHDIRIDPKDTRNANLMALYRRPLAHLLKSKWIRLGGSR